MIGSKFSLLPASVKSFPFSSPLTARIDMNEILCIEIRWCQWHSLRFTSWDNKLLFVMQ